MYIYAKYKLDEKNIPYTKHISQRLEITDYDKYDHFICMEESNIRNCLKIFKEDKQNKIIKLLDKDIEDPWYNGNFDKTYNELTEGIDKLIKETLEKI